MVADIWRKYLRMTGVRGTTDLPESAENCRQSEQDKKKNLLMLCRLMEQNGGL